MARNASTLAFRELVTPGRRPDWSITAALVLAVLAAYARMLHADFIGYDDPQYVVDNDVVRAGLGWRTLGWALTTVTVERGIPSRGSRMRSMRACTVSTPRVIT
jgi:hypothetical protein